MPTPRLERYRRHSVNFLGCQRVHPWPY